MILPFQKGYHLIGGLAPPFIAFQRNFLLDKQILPIYYRYMPDRSSKKPVDLNKLAKSIVDEATMEELQAKAIAEGKNPSAVMLGRLGGLKGGKARAKKLSASQRSEIAKKAAQARWKNESH
jgi:hypothetical protein